MSEDVPYFMVVVSGLYFHDWLRLTLDEAGIPHCVADLGNGMYTVWAGEDLPEPADEEVE